MPDSVTTLGLHSEHGVQPATSAADPLIPAPAAVGHASAAGGGPQLRLAAVAVLALVCLVALFWGSGILYPLDKTESLQLDIARTMLAEGNAVVPRVSGAPYFDKPPLPYWVAWPLLRSFPSDPWLARLGSGLASTLGVAATVVIAYVGIRGGPEGEARRLGRAVLAGVVLAVLPGTAAFARVAVHDSYLATAILVTNASLYALVFAASLSRRQRWLLAVLAGVAMGVGFLAKGLLTWALPSALLLGFALLSRQLPQLWRQRSRLSLVAALALAIPLPWLLAATREAGSAFLAGFLGHSNLERVARTVDHHSGAWFYYLPALLLLTFPWGLIGLIRPRLWRQLIRPGRPQRRQLELWALAWVVLTVLPLSLASTKLPHYILSCLPGVALLTATALVPVESSSAPEGKATASLLRALGWGTAALLAGAALLPPALVARSIHPDKVFPEYTDALVAHLNALPFRALLLLMAAGMVLAVLLPGLRPPGARRLTRQGETLALGWLLVALLSYGAVVPGLALEYRQHRQQALLELADAVSARMSGDAPIVILGKSYHSVALRSGHSIARVDSWPELVELRHREPEALPGPVLAVITPQAKEPSTAELEQAGLQPVGRQVRQNLVALELRPHH